MICVDMELHLIGMNQMKMIKVEIADTPFLLAHGLMGRTNLDKSAGMLFKFQSPIEARFWGKNTYLPLDIAFIHNNTITSIQKIIPMSTKYVHSNGACSMAIETNAGFFKEHNIDVGHKIKLVSQNNEHQVIFED